MTAGTQQFGRMVSLDTPSLSNAAQAITSSRRAIFVIAGLLALATLLAYANALRVPMQFDDKVSLTENPSILKLWPLSVPLSPPKGWGFTVEGRPLLNLSLALNYAWGGFDMRGYHAVNVIIHLLAGLTLFGVLRRTLSTPVLRAKFGAQATSLATIGAVFWTLHPVNVESVTYIVQRAESLSGLFLLFTLYAFIRATDGPTLRISWTILALLACLCGMAVKEVMVVAPVLLALYDRTFLAGGFRKAWTAHGKLHLALFATWILLACLVLGAGSRGGTFALNDPQAWWRYSLTQWIALARYLRLAVWPHPLIFDYGTFWVSGMKALPYAIVVLSVAGATIWGLFKSPVFGFLGAWFFISLAPSSALPGTIQMVVEHRMYLPLVAFTGLVIALATLASERLRLVLALGLAVGFGIAVHVRNNDYRTEVALWTDTVEKIPTNARALANLGSALLSAGRVEEAEVRLQQAKRLDPINPELRYSLGLSAIAQHRYEDAVRELGEAVRIKPKLSPALFHQAKAYLALGRRDEAITALRRAVEIRPLFAEAHLDLGVQLAEKGERDAAIIQYLTALEIRPNYAEAAIDLGALLLRSGRPDLAVENFQKALKVDNSLAAAHYNLAQAWAKLGQGEAALKEYAESIRLEPKNAEMHLNYGVALAQIGRLPEARAELETATRLNPELPEAQQNLGNVLTELGDTTLALSAYETSIRLRPTYVQAHFNYANALLKVGQIEAARQHFFQAVSLDPDFAPAREMLARVDAALSGRGQPR